MSIGADNAGFGELAHFELLADLLGWQQFNHAVDFVAT
jgi:hypothetical protein